MSDVSGRENIKTELGLSFQNLCLKALSIDLRKPEIPDFWKINLGLDDYTKFPREFSECISSF